MRARVLLVAAMVVALVGVGGGLALRQRAAPVVIQVADAGLVAALARPELASPVVDAGAPSPRLAEGWIDSPSGASLRAGPDVTQPALTSLSDQAKVDVLEEGAEVLDGSVSAARGRWFGRWLRVRAGTMTGWVLGDVVARGPTTIQLAGGLMLRSFEDTWSGDARTDFAAFQHRDGQWQPRPLPAVTDLPISVSKRVSGVRGGGVCKR